MSKLRTILLTLSFSLIGLAGTATAQSAPFVIGNVGSSDVTKDSATITWTTSVAANSVVRYGTDQNYADTKTDDSLVTSHSLAISGLTSGKVYHYMVKSTDAANNTLSSEDKTFVTDGVTLNIFIVDQNGKALSGAVVKLAGLVATTDSKGQVTFKGLPSGKQTASVTYNGGTITRDVVINPADTPENENQTQTLTVSIKQTPLWVFIAIGLLAAALVALVMMIVRRRPPSNLPPADSYSPPPMAIT